jgi:hypothetical protein
MNVGTETLQDDGFAQDEINQIDVTVSEKPGRLAARRREERSQQRAKRKKRKPRLHCASRIKVHVTAPVAIGAPLRRFYFRVQGNRRRAA